MGTRWTLEDIERIKNRNHAKPEVTQKAPAVVTSANDLTKQALNVFRCMGFEAWRQNNGGVYDPKIEKFRANSSTPGISDIIGYHRVTGVFLACEIKVGKDKLREEQEIFLAKVKRAGGLALVFRTSDDIESFSKKFKQKVSK